MPRFRGITFDLAATKHPVSAEQLRAAEALLGCTFPPDYRDFVLQFGAGEFRELALAVPSPKAVAARTPDDRTRLREFWFWTASPEVWSQEKACGSIACFDGSSGDDVRFHPSDPQAMYILPHDHEYICRVTNFDDLISRFAEIYGTDRSKLTFIPDRISGA